VDLSVDTYPDRAWIGIVPFCMRKVRPIALPFLSSNFLELNLRTYVRDVRGVRGIWFYSLDANNPMAVWTARLFFGLPYKHSEMRVESTMKRSDVLPGAAAPQLSKSTDSGHPMSLEKPNQARLNFSS
jgi:uncharacterized protein YqjF (DUF2071 family)